MCVKIEHTVGIQNKDFFQNAFLMVMFAETLATIKVKIAKIYASVREKHNDIHGKLNKIDFCYKFYRICQSGRLAAIIKDILSYEMTTSVRSSIYLTVQCNFSTLNFCQNDKLFPLIYN